MFAQCTDTLQDKLKSHPEFPAAYQDGIALLRIIKMLTYMFKEQFKLADALCDIKEMFYTFKQGKNTSLQRYYEQFLGQVKVIDQVGVTIPDERLVEAIATANGRHGAPNDADWAQAREQALAVRFIRGANNNHKGYLTHLCNSFLDGTDYYPAMLHEAYHILQRREPEGGSIPVGVEPELAFVTAGSGGGQPRGCGSGGKIVCFQCGQQGHIATNCTNPQQQQEASAQEPQQQQGTNLCMNGTEEAPASDGGFMFSQLPGTPIPATWILLDNQSTVDLFQNSRLLKNIHRSDRRMSVQCNAGERTTDMVSDLPGYGTVWYHSNSIANILSLMRVARKYRVQFDSEDGGKFVVTKPDGTVFTFEASERAYSIWTPTTRPAGRRRWFSSIL
jgi:Zinc knuckle